MEECYFEFVEMLTRWRELNQFLNSTGYANTSMSGKRLGSRSFLSVCCQMLVNSKY